MEFVIDAYHQLWHIEKKLQMSKHDPYRHGRNCEDLPRGCEGFVKNVAHSASNQHRGSMTLRTWRPRSWRGPVPPVRG